MRGAVEQGVVLETDAAADAVDFLERRLGHIVAQLLFDGVAFGEADHLRVVAGVREESIARISTSCAER